MVELCEIVWNLFLNVIRDKLPSCSLLVHFHSGTNTINREKNHFFGMYFQQDII